MAALALGAAACGRGGSKDEPPPPPVVQPAPRPVARDVVRPSLPRGNCEPATGAIVGRAGLRGAMFTIDPDRQILVLYDANGSLRYYRDQVSGQGGYTVRIDRDVDSAWVMDRTTRARMVGPAADFSARREFGPPAAIADSVRRRCGIILVPADSAPPAPEPRR